MQKRHQDYNSYFHEQSFTTEKHVLPWIKKHHKIQNPYTMMEVGFGFGGNLLPFTKEPCNKIVGVDVSEIMCKIARNQLVDKRGINKVELICENFLKLALEEKVDLIFARDVIEHIKDHQKFLNKISSLLKPGGRAFIAFPPWQNPYGGHQQISKSKILPRLPYFHIAPDFIYRGILKHLEISMSL